MDKKAKYTEAGIDALLELLVAGVVAQGLVIASMQEHTRSQVETAGDAVKAKLQAAGHDKDYVQRAMRFFNTCLAIAHKVKKSTADIAKARLEKAKRDLAVIENDLNYVQILAPIAGTVASVATQEGETVAAQFTTPTFVTIIEDNALANKLVDTIRVRQ